MEPIVQATDTISILYVEDEQECQDLLISMLIPIYPDLSFYTAGSGLVGLEMFRQHRPSIVITDISIPEMDGISMAGKIKTVAPDTIIIALTAHSETDNLIRAIKIGVTHYILKPLDFERICAVIDQSIATVKKDQQLQYQYEQILALNSALTARTQDLECLNWELESFSYTVAHDLRAPIVNIGNYAQSLLEQCVAGHDEKNIRDLQVIYKETLHMNGLIGALLNFSLYSRKSIAKEWTNFSRIVNEIAVNLTRQNPLRRAIFKISYDVHGFCDPVLLRVALENLLSNAWKYSEKTDAACIEFGATNIHEELVYYVRDNGIGFDHEEAANIFIPFKRLHCDGEFDGFGIGLATACRIIQRHGGKIWAEGERGRRATFYFTL